MITKELYLAFLSFLIIFFPKEERCPSYNPKALHAYIPPSSPDLCLQIYVRIARVWDATFLDKMTTQIQGSASAMMLLLFFINFIFLYFKNT